MVKLDAKVLAAFATDKARKTAHVASECNGKVSRKFFAGQSKEWGTVAAKANGPRK